MTRSGSPMIVTIDGPAGVGKSTLAGRTADALGMAYLDTGAMFRTVALRLVRAGLAPDSDVASAPEVADILKGCEFALKGTGSDTRLLCDGTPVGDEIRSEEAGMMAAQAGRSPAVRAFLKAAQQELGKRFSLVAEGRDMGTVVFPDAACKIFLDASPEVRAERRFLQLQAMGLEADRDALAGQIRLRDEQDRNRPLAPLKPADDARIIDTSDKNIDAVFTLILDAVRRADRPMECAVRRKDRVLTEEEASGVLQRAEYGILAVDDGSGWPYAVPLSFAFAEGAVYFHCARSGRKIDALARNSRICFTVVCDTEPVYDGSFSTYYESAMVFGRAALVEEEEEKYRGLYLLAERYLPGDMDKADGEIRHHFKRTALYRVVPELITGKAKRKKK